MLLPIASFDTHVLASFGWKNGDFDGLVWLLKMLIRKSRVQALFGCGKMVILKPMRFLVCYYFLFLSIYNVLGHYYFAEFYYIECNVNTVGVSYVRKL